MESYDKKVNTSDGFMGKKLIEEFWILLQLYSCKCPHFPNISHMLILYIFQQIYTHKNILFDTFFRSVYLWQILQILHKDMSVKR